MSDGLKAVAAEMRDAAEAALDALAPAELEAAFADFAFAEGELVAHKASAAGCGRPEPLLVVGRAVAEDGSHLYAARDGRMGLAWIPEGELVPYRKPAPVTDNLWPWVGDLLKAQREHAAKPPAATAGPPAAAAGPPQADSLEARLRQAKRRLIDAQDFEGAVAVRDAMDALKKPAA